MTHVSKVPVDPAIYLRVRKNLRSAVSDRHIYGPDILEALLTPAERTMLSKRLAIVVLLERNYSYYKISKLLKVSIATVMRTNRLRNKGRFSAIQRAMKKKKDGLTILEYAEIILSAGMPSMAGPRETRRLNRLRSKATS
jgi:Trp operon repressor